MCGRIKRMKQIIIYGKHRNVDPIVKANKEKYLFVNFKNIHKIAKLVKIITKSEKTYARSIYLILSIIKPKAILSCNWITKAQKVFYLYSKKTNCDFVVVQHGAYYGGLVTAKDHRYMKCSKFLVWGDYFKRTFDNYNPSNKDNIVIFGNPVFNSIVRSQYDYPTSINKILIAFTFIQDSDLHLYEKVLEKISYSNIDFDVKYHNFQRKKYTGFSEKEVNGNIPDIIHSYDLVICDHSTVLLDAVFFKRFIIFADHSSVGSYYEKYLNNYFTHLSNSSQISELDRLVDIEAQEHMFIDAVYSGDNNFEVIIAK